MAAKLHSMRRDFITQASSTIFPIEVEALSQQDAGEEGKGKRGGVEVWGIGEGRRERGGRERRRKEGRGKGKGRRGRRKE